MWGSDHHLYRHQKRWYAQGPNLETTEVIADAVSVDVIASGGITSIQDVQALKAIGVHGAIVGRALYTGALDLQDAIAVAR